MTKASRVGALDIAEVISSHLGSFVSFEELQFVAVENDVIDLWYMNSGGDGPTFHIQLTRDDGEWLVDLKELPPGTEQQIELP